MILILSQGEIEESTNHVIDWLNYKNASYVRINGTDFDSIAKIKLEVSNKSNTYSIEDKGSLISSNEDIRVIWYRRWSQKDFYKGVSLPDQHRESLDYSLSQHLAQEFISAGNAWFNYFENVKWLNQPASLSKRKNKIDILRQAVSVGLNIPDTLITNQKKDIIPFLKKHQKIISKCISEVSFFKYQNEIFAHYTISLDETDLVSLPDEFYLSLFQEFIPKKYEIRVFFFDNKTYSMAIFSQEIEQTSLDFRKYSTSTPNRVVPYILPDTIETKIIELMNSLQLNSGSIDLVYTPLGEYIFLEVNPVGQFGMVSIPCNYFIEEKIADFLIANDK